MIKRAGKQRRGKKLLLAVAFLLLLIVVLLSLNAHKVLRLVSPDHDASVAIPIVLVCQSDQSVCIGGVPEISVTLNLQQPDFPPLKPLLFQFSVRDRQDAFREIEFIEASIAGRDMFMGVHPLALESESQRGTLRLSGMVPVCVTGTDMVWRTTLKFESQNQLYIAQVDLRSLKASQDLSHIKSE